VRARTRSSAASGQLVDEAGGRRVAHPQALLAGGHAEPDEQVALARARVAQEDDRLPGRDPGQRLERGERGRRHGGGRGEVEVGEALGAREAGLGDAPLPATGVALLELGGEDLGEEGPVRQAVPGGGLGETGVLGPHGGQPQRPAGAIDGQRRGLLGDRRAHREAPPARSAS
jgi:hypothetical protein